MANILVVDDDESVAVTVCSVLKKKGYQAQRAGNGAKVLEQLGVKPVKSGLPMPDLIIMDLDLPVVDGCTIIRNLYDNAGTRSIPVIIMSGRDPAIEVSEMSPNVKHYIEKPGSLEDLLAVIRHVLPRRKEIL